MPTIILRLLTLAAFVLLLGGCGKKPAPEPLPSPMTVDYLLTHMNVSPVPGTGALTVQPLPYTTRTVFHDANATLQCLVQAQFPEKRPTAPEAAAYQLLFSLTASRWGEFKTAFDTLGNRFDVVPYVSGIRQGVYTEVFYVVVSEEWIASAAGSDVSLLLLSREEELGMTLPNIYPLALKRYLEQRDENGSDPF